MKRQASSYNMIKPPVTIFRICVTKGKIIIMKDSDVILLKCYESLVTLKLRIPPRLLEVVDIIFKVRLANVERDQLYM